MAATELLLKQSNKLTAVYENLQLCGRTLCVIPHVDWLKKVTWTALCEHELFMISQVAIMQHSFGQGAVSSTSVLMYLMFLRFVKAEEEEFLLT